MTYRVTDDVAQEWSTIHDIVNYGFLTDATSDVASRSKRAIVEGLWREPFLNDKRLGLGLGFEEQVLEVAVVDLATNDRGIPAEPP